MKFQHFLGGSNDDCHQCVIMTLVIAKKDMAFVYILMSWAFEYVKDYNYEWPQADQASWWWAQLAKTHKNSSN